MAEDGLLSTKAISQLIRMTFGRAVSLNRRCLASVLSFEELKEVKIPSGIEVDCEIFDPTLKASEIEEIRIH